MTKIKKKQSVLKLMRKHSIIFESLAVMLGLGVLFVIPGIISKYTEFVYIQAFIWEVIVLAIAMFGIVLIGTLCSYIRMFFTYAKLPLTVEEAKMLSIDKSPIEFLDKLKKMMTYHDFFDEFSDKDDCCLHKVINDSKVDDALSKLFYELFFTPDETYARPAIITGLTKDIASEMEDDLFLVGICKGFTCYLHTIIHGDIEFSPILDAAVPEDMTYGEEKVKVYAILQTEGNFYLITENNYYCKANKKNLSIAEYVEKHKSKETSKEKEITEE